MHFGLDVSGHRCGLSLPRKGVERPPRFSDKSPQVVRIDQSSAARFAGPENDTVLKLALRVALLLQAPKASNLGAALE